jgi:hypothetical protein
MLMQFKVLYPDEELVRVAMRGAATYRLSWFDTHMWAYAERFGLETLWSEDFEDGRLYGRVRARGSVFSGQPEVCVPATGGKPSGKEQENSEPFWDSQRRAREPRMSKPRLKFQGFLKSTRCAA